MTLITIHPLCPCCTDTVPRTVTAEAFAAALRDVARTTNPRDPWFYSERVARRHIADLNALADKVDAGHAPHPSDFEVGLSLAQQGLARALQLAGWREATPYRAEYNVTPAKSVLPATYGDE